MQSSVTRSFGAGACLSLALIACSGDPGNAIPNGNAAPDMPAAPAATSPVATTPTPAPAAKPPGTIALTVSVAGTGHVTSAPAGIDCPGAACTASFAPGTKILLTAAPAEGWKLDAWSGACTGGGACALTLAADTTVKTSLALLDARWDPSVGAQDCVDAWGKNGEKLSSCDTVPDDYVVVHKSKRNVALCKSSKLVKNLRSGLGSTPIGTKQKDGDGKTPEGVFFVPELVPTSSFYKAFLLSYPGPDDAQRGYTAGLITSDVRAQITSAQSACVAPPQDTALGGQIELQGNGSSTDWTAGNIALDDASVDLLWSSIGVGDTIVVIP
jgi:hypothetical protein